jgi:RND family efflux transporter MFP subunit
VSVPEGYVPVIHTGGHAQLAFQEYSGVPYFGEITRTANSIDPNTRTMLTEVQVDNKQGKLVPGMYVVATFPPPPGEEAALLVTGDAIAVRNDTPVVAIVRDGKIHLQPVVLGRDFGTAVEILNGLKDGDTIVTNVTDDVAEGREVQISMTKSPEQTPASPPSQNTPPGGSTQYGEPGITDQNLQGQNSSQNKKGSGQSPSKGKPSNSESKQ